MSEPLLLNHFDPTARWMRRGGRENDVVLSSRVRLARNLKRYNFPHLSGAADLISIRDRALLALEKSAHGANSDLLIVPFEEFTSWERQSLIDRHLTSPGHIKEELGRAVCATLDGALSVLINEEDHLRVQTLLPGLQFDAAYALADKMDDALENYFDERGGLAFDSQFGFLTACPTNAGTGLRVSAMLHLPALEIVEKLETVRRWTSGRGLTLRGTFGEGSKVWGHLHQLSNQNTLGLDETEILLEMDAATRDISEQERAARESLPAQFPLEARDLIGRAFGTLRYARTLSCREATEALSLLRLGHEIGWMKGISRQKFNELMVWIRPAYLQVAAGKVVAGNERDALRATLLRPIIARVKLESGFEDTPAS
ncbi:protein arginine kinase [Abditibacterium utsteinense]|uniref:Protein arginine kinase n=1 Tax=Abditibacterium utsteinense TaxID=1960156 RepID=A0A2S8SSY4_9BACT|nr:ATP--guanido phosphotransferase [Abditibacterium utsteinense]PQV63911.1 protein arginine kinase [Abditibacterium utsteinense]